MRIGFGLVALLLVMAVVLLLSARSTRRTVDLARAVARASDETAAPRAWDAAAAGALAARLRAWLAEPVPPRGELAAAAGAAAGWVAGTAPGTREHHAAVALRAAAGELALASAALDDPHRAIARGRLDDAESTLAGAPPRELAPIQGIRDQLENLQNSRREQASELP